MSVSFYNTKESYPKSFLDAIRVNAPSLYKVITVLKEEKLTASSEQLVTNIWQAVNEKKTDIQNFEINFKNLNSQINWIETSGLKDSPLTDSLIQVEGIRIRAALGLKKSRWLASSEKKEWTALNAWERVQNMQRALPLNVIEKFWNVANQQEIEKKFRQLIDQESDDERDEDWDLSQLRKEIAKLSYNSLTTPLLSTSGSPSSLTTETTETVTLDDFSEFSSCPYRALD
ncbi:MAG: hypothetical protein KGI80_03540 [Verrucomicrobiota bacterium]|nr:hypothetical protein [Verrucomicrobiota bacterium]